MTLFDKETRLPVLICACSCSFLTLCASLYYCIDSLRDRLDVSEAKIRNLQEEVKQQEELRQEAVFGLWETINVTEKKCDECIHSCGGLD